MRPVSEKEALEMDMTQEAPIWTICEVLRVAYKIAEEIGNQQLKKEVQMKIREATVLSKRISKKLKEYKQFNQQEMFRKKG